MSEIKNGGLDLDGIDHFYKCNHLMPLQFEGLNSWSVWISASSVAVRKRTSLSGPSKSRCKPARHRGIVVSTLYCALCIIVFVFFRRWCFSDILCKVRPPVDEWYTVLCLALKSSLIVIILYISRHLWRHLLPDFISEAAKQAIVFSFLHLTVCVFTQ